MRSRYSALYIYRREPETVSRFTREIASRIGYTIGEKREKPFPKKFTRKCFLRNRLRGSCMVSFYEWIADGFLQRFEEMDYTKLWLKDDLIEMKYIVDVCLEDLHGSISNDTIKRWLMEFISLLQKHGIPLSKKLKEWWD